MIVENDYLTQGDRRVTVEATRSSFVNTLRELLRVRPLGVSSFLTLFEGVDSAVAETEISNYVNTSQNASWRLTTDEGNASSSSTITVDDKVFVLTESNYSGEGAYATAMVINSSLYNDSKSGVVVI